MEELFVAGVSNDSDNDGTNRTGTYVLRIKLKRDIPQLLPILGKRIKINYPGRPRQCTNCFRIHANENANPKRSHGRNMHATSQGPTKSFQLNCLGVGC